MFIETSYWDDENEVKVLEAWEPGWLLTGHLGPYYYSTTDWNSTNLYHSWGAPWPEDWQCDDVAYSD